MDGRSLVSEARETAALATHSVSAPYTPEQEAAVESRLRNLGYFE